MIPAWLASLMALNTPAILVTVAHTQGSVPRETGAKMLVTADCTTDTIGGGHLELNATAFARRMLNDSRGSPANPRLERFALGPTLGQCCGGVVFLAFEPVDAGDLALWHEIERRLQAGLDTWRIAHGEAHLPMVLAQAAPQADADLEAHGTGPRVGRRANGGAACHVLWHGDGGWTLADPVAAACPHLYLFGAGHVGAALVRAVSLLPCRITWVDEREELFPHVLPPNVEAEATDSPEALIDAAPSQASFLVMTHSHALDQRLAERILRRDDIAWFGLIGSRTKRIQFERRLTERGIAAERLSRMVCPVGIPGIDGKAPAVIAAAIAAQLMMAWETQSAAAADRAAAADKEEDMKAEKLQGLKRQ